MTKFKKFHPRQLKMLKEISDSPELMKIIAEKRMLTINTVKGFINRRLSARGYQKDNEWSYVLNAYRKHYLEYKKRTNENKISS